MKQRFIISCVLLSLLTACKKKEESVTLPLPVSTSPIDKLPDASTGWTIAPCKLIDEEQLRQILKIEDATIVLIPDVAKNNQSISSCTYRWKRTEMPSIVSINKKVNPSAQFTLSSIVISYTGKYPDAAAAANSLDMTIKNPALGKHAIIEGVGTKAVWAEQGNQLIIQKDAYIFYVQANIDLNKNLDSAKQLAVAACKLL